MVPLLNINKVFSIIMQ